ncbi:uncharacterized protein Hap1MRO34_003937 isoform 2-T4 [Clarias gariepinus]
MAHLGFRSAGQILLQASRCLSVAPSNWNSRLKDATLTPDNRAALGKSSAEVIFNDVNGQNSPSVQEILQTAEEKIQTGSVLHNYSYQTYLDVTGEDLPTAANIIQAALEKRGKIFSSPE